MPDTNFPNGIDVGSLKINGTAVTKTAAQINAATANPEQAAVANVASADAVVAAGANPTKAEFDALVALTNETKAQLNTALAKLRLADIIAG